jgi:hypothetical protein
MDLSYIEYELSYKIRYSMKDSWKKWLEEEEEYVSSY